jgi:hypothetical protein
MTSPRRSTPRTTTCLFEASGEAGEAGKRTGPPGPRSGRTPSPPPRASPGDASPPADRQTSRPWDWLSSKGRNSRCLNKLRLAIQVC